MAKEHAGKIVSLMSEYCLCQRVKPCGDPKSPFKSDDEYIAALQVRDTTISRLWRSFEAHHTVMLKAVKCKQ